MACRSLPGTHNIHKQAHTENTSHQSSPHPISCSVSVFWSGKPLMGLTHQREFKLPVSSWLPTPGGSSRGSRQRSQGTTAPGYNRQLPLS